VNSRNSKEEALEIIRHMPFKVRREKRSLSKHGRINEVSKT
jgi:hypothetical protein